MKEYRRVYNTPEPKDSRTYAWQAGWVSSGILHSLSCAQQDGTYACISVKGSCETCVLRLLKTPKTCLRFEGRADAPSLQYNHTSSRGSQARAVGQCRHLLAF
jgi:hypothetical protein